VLEAPLTRAGKQLGSITLWRHDGPAFDHHDQEDLARVAAQERQVFNRRTLPPFCLRLVESVVHGGRESARTNMEVSDAVLRDCVKAVYEKFGCSSEAGLLEQLRPAAARI
jgi:hypothetical protein